MIVTEYYMTRKDGVRLYKKYSDKNVMIQKIGTEEIYDIAIDVETNLVVYVETDIPIPVYDENGGEENNGNIS